MTAAHRFSSSLWGLVVGVSIMALVLAVLAAPGSAYGQTETEGSPDQVTSGAESQPQAGIQQLSPGEEPDTVRRAGASRFQTAVDISAAQFDAAADVLIATGEEFPDALAGATLGGAVDAPILLVPRTLQAGSLPDEVTEEIDRLGADTLHLLGGTDAIASEVEQYLLDQTGATDANRVAGPTRFETAEEIGGLADDIDPDAGTMTRNGETVRGAFLATGLNFPDSLAAGPGAYAGTHPIFLTTPTSLHAAAERGLDAFDTDVVFVLGGSEAVSAAVEQQLEDQGYEVERLSGTTRFDTAVDVAETFEEDFGFDPQNVGLASGEVFPDALTAGPYAGENAAPLVLSGETTIDPGISTATGDYLEARQCLVELIHIFGGTARITAEAEQEAVDAAACPPEEDGTIAGTVTDAETEEPIEGAEILVENAETYTATTDAEGDYSVQVAPNETYTVTADADGYESDTEDDVTVAPGETATVDFSLEPLPGSVSGAVTAEEGGAAIEGATVTLSPEDDSEARDTTTGSDGSYEFADVARGNYTLEVDGAEGFDDVEEPLSVGPGEDVEHDAPLILAEGWVLNTGTAETYDNVQEGVNEASEDDELVARGEFDESVQIDQPLSLSSSQAGHATIVFAPDTETGEPTILATSVGVTLEDLTVERVAADDRGDDPSPFTQGVMVRDAAEEGDPDTVITGLTVEGTDLADPTNSGIMIRSDEGELDSHVVVSGNVVNGFASGIAVTESDGGAGTDGAVTDVLLTGNFAHGYAAGVAIGSPDIDEDEPVAEVTDNEIAASNDEVVGLILAHELPDGSVSGNVFDGEPDYTCVWDSTEDYVQALEEENDYPEDPDIYDPEDDVWCIGEDA